MNGDEFGVEDSNRWSLKDLLENAKQEPVPPTRDEEIAQAMAELVEGYKGEGSTVHKHKDLMGFCMRGDGSIVPIEATGKDFVQSFASWGSSYCIPTLLFRGALTERAGDARVADTQTYIEQIALSVKASARNDEEYRGLALALSEVVDTGMINGGSAPDNFKFLKYTGKRTGIVVVNSISVDTLQMGPGSVVDPDIEGKFDDFFDDIMEIGLKMAIEYGKFLKGRRRSELENVWASLQAQFGHCVMRDVPNDAAEKIVWATAAVLAVNLMTSGVTGIRVPYRMAFSGIMAGIEMNLLTARRGKARNIYQWEDENKCWSWVDGCNILLRMNDAATDLWRTKMLEYTPQQRRKSSRRPSMTMVAATADTIEKRAELMVGRYLSLMLDMPEHLLEEKLFYYGMGVKSGDGPVPCEVAFEQWEREIVHGSAIEVLFKAGSGDRPHIYEMGTVLAGERCTAHLYIDRDENKKGK